MKLIRKRPSKTDKYITVFEFGIGHVEMVLIKGVLKDSVKKIPNIFETSQVRARLREMVKELEKTIREDDNEKTN